MILYRVLFQILFILTVIEKHNLRKMSSGAMISPEKQPNLMPEHRGVTKDDFGVNFFFLTCYRFLTPLRIAELRATALNGQNGFFTQGHLKIAVTLQFLILSQKLKQSWTA